MDKQKTFFIGIGPPKTGTSWLFFTLQNHPDVELPQEKEIRYFWVNQNLGGSTLIKRLFSSHWNFKLRRVRFWLHFKAYLKGWSKGKFFSSVFWWEVKFFFLQQNDKWYLNLFNHHKITGDITPKYCELSEIYIAKIQRLLPHAKIIISFRDPIDRSWSRAKMVLVKNNKLKDYRKVPAKKMEKNFKNIAQLEANDYVALLQRWRKYFPEEQIFFFFYDELKNNPYNLYHKICKFLELDSNAGKALTDYVNKGINQQIPEEYEKILVQLNYNYLLKMASFFKSPYPRQWLEKYQDKYEK